MPVSKLLEELSAAEIFEWMAYDLTQNEEFNQKILKEIEMERQSSLTQEQQDANLVNMFKSIANKGNK